MKWLETKPVFRSLRWSYDYSILCIPRISNHANCLLTISARFFTLSRDFWGHGQATDLKRWCCQFIIVGSETAGPITISEKVVSVSMQFKVPNHHDCLWSSSLIIFKILRFQSGSSLSHVAVRIRQRFQRTLEQLGRVCTNNGGATAAQITLFLHEPLPEMESKKEISMETGFAANQSCSCHHTGNWIGQFFLSPPLVWWRI